MPSATQRAAVVLDEPRSLAALAGQHLAGRARLAVGAQRDEQRIAGHVGTVRGLQRVLAAAGVQEDRVPLELRPEVLAGEHPLLPFAEVVGVAGELDHATVRRMRQANGDVLLGQVLGLVVLVLLVEKEHDLVGGIVGHGGLEELRAAVGDMGHAAGDDQPGGNSLAAVAHLDLDADQRFLGQPRLGLAEQLPLGVAEGGVDVVLGHHGGAALGLRLDDQVAVLALDHARLFHGQGPQPPVVRIADQPAFPLRRVENLLGRLTEFRIHGTPISAGKQGAAGRGHRSTLPEIAKLLSIARGGREIKGPAQASLENARLRKPPPCQPCPPAGHRRAAKKLLRCEIYEHENAIYNHQSEDFVQIFHILG